MIKKSFLFGAIASVIAINSVFADTIVTSKKYVDDRDALKQDKITAGTTGNVVLYNGTQNGQTQFAERAIYDDYDVVIDENNSNDLVTAGALLKATDYIYDEISNIPAPELPTGTAGHFAGFDGDRNLSSTSYFADQRYNNDSLWSGEWGYPDTQLVTVDLLYNNSTDNPNEVLSGRQKLVNGSALRRATANAATYNNGALTNGNYFATINAVETKQAKMTCAGWPDNIAVADRTDANCWLWNKN